MTFKDSSLGQLYKWAKDVIYGAYGGVGVADLKILNGCDPADCFVSEGGVWVLCGVS